MLEDDGFVAFLDIRPLFHGLVLLVPRAHHEALWDLPDDLHGELLRTTRDLSVAVRDAMEAVGVFVAINNVVSQSVPHLHVHVVPRWRKDGLFGRNFVWKRQPYPDEAAAEAARDAIRSALERLGRSEGAEQIGGTSAEPKPPG